MTRPYTAPWRPPMPPGPKRLTSAQSTRLTVIAVAGVVLGALIGLALASMAPTVYIGRTEVEYHLRVENASYFQRTDSNLSTQTILMTDRSVLGPVAAANGMSWEDLDKSVDAYIVDNTDILRIDVRNPDRATGVKLADAIATQYLSKLDGIGPQVSLKDQLDAARTALANAAPPAVPAAQARVSLLQGQLDLARITGNTADVVTPAYSVPTPASPNRWGGTRIGAVCGALLAGLTVLLLYRRWTTVQ
ncbi:MAG TPA: hypothetical protein VGH89_17295 [Pseudonocardia sp.]